MLKFLLLWASITFSHQECHNYVKIIRHCFASPWLCFGGVLISWTPRSSAITWSYRNSAQKVIISSDKVPNIHILHEQRIWQFSFPMSEFILRNLCNETTARSQVPLNMGFVCHSVFFFFQIPQVGALARILSTNY